MTSKPAGIYVKSGGVLVPATSIPGTGPQGNQGIQGLQGAAASGIVVGSTAPVSPTLNTFWCDTSGVLVDYDAGVIADGASAFWKYNEASGTSAVDSSGNSRNATYTNAPLLGAVGLVPSKTDTCMACTSDAGNCTTIASAAWMNTNDWTIECLVNFTSATDGTNGDAIMSRYLGAGLDWLMWRNTAGQLAVQARNSAGTTYNVASGVAVTLGATNYVAATWNQSLLSLYVAGQPVASVAVTGVALQTAAPIEVGRYSQSNPTTPGARFARAAVYPTALTPTKIYNRFLAVQ